MWQTKLCIATSERLELSETEQITLFKSKGFDGFFTGWSPDKDIAALKVHADREGMLYQSLHAPFKNSKYMWTEGKDTEAAVAELIACAESCARNGIGLMVAHAFIGFKDHTPNEAGLRNFERVAARAKELGVKIALENTEGEEYLEALMAHLRGYENVGFCWDTGHELCYNHSKDMLALYGDRLLGTHLNDNLGIRDFGGEITYYDDLHLLPFDGVGDWEDIAARLAAHHFDGPLTFELSFAAHLRDSALSFYPYNTEQYVEHAFVRACKLATLLQKKRSVF